VREVFLDLELDLLPIRIATTKHKTNCGGGARLAGRKGKENRETNEENEFV